MQNILILALVQFLALATAFVSNDFAATEAAKTARVVNGEEAEVGRYPYQAFVQMETFLGTGLCGGTLISPSVVLTAAHCLASRIRSITVILGCDDISEINVDCEVHEGLTSYEIAPEYRNAVYGYDYAVILLDTPSVKTPISLPGIDFEFIEGLPLTVAGYGKIEFDEGVSSRLLEAQLYSIDPEKCNEQYNNVFEIQTGSSADIIIEDQMFCALSDEATACSGDSGGPLFVKCDGGDVQFAVVSFGFACVTSGIPTVYANLLNEGTISFLAGHANEKGENLTFVDDLADVCSPEPEIEVYDMEMIDPEGWTCSGRSFASGDGCDCNCGIRDPDCDWDTEVICVNEQVALVEESTTPYKIALSIMTMLGAAGSIIGFLYGRLEKKKLQEKEQEKESVEHFIKPKL